MIFLVTEDALVWREALNRFSPPLRDVYFTWEYCQGYERNGDGLVRAAFFVGPHGTRVLYPFLLKIIPGLPENEPWFDLKSPYGYSGPLVEDPHPEDLAAFEEEFLAWGRKNRIVAEFIRFHPLFDNHLHFRREIRVDLNRPTVLLDLRQPMPQFMARFSPMRRRNLRKALQEDLSVGPGQDYAGFQEVYRETMQRVGADPFYFFSTEYFATIEAMDPRMRLLIEVRFQGNLVAAALFLVGPQCLHYHLGGSREAAFPLHPNESCFFHAFAWGQENGLTSLHLGGGSTTSPDDSLLRFKTGFGQATGRFFIGRRIHDPQRYRQLMDRWRAENGREPTLFLQYHQMRKTS